MKKLSIALALVLAATAAQAEPVTIDHQTAGGLADELTACGVDAANITELTITGDAVMNKADFTALRTSLAATLVKLDLSQAKFENDRLPGDEGTNDKTVGPLQGMTALVECKVPETLTAFMCNAFYNCTSLTTVNIPAVVKVIHQHCFHNCPKLSLEALPESLTDIRADAFNGDKALKLTVIPANVYRIAGSAFKDSGVQFSVLPEGLKEIHENCFSNAPVTFSEWPSTLTLIKEKAFSGTKVTFKEFCPTVSSVTKGLFQSVATIKEFTINNVGTVWEQIPDATFWLKPNTFTRTFICRAPKAPKARHGKQNNDWTDEWNCVFGEHVVNYKEATFPNTTFKVLASALSTYEAEMPYSSMKLEILTTPLTDHAIEAPTDVTNEHYTVSFVANETEYTDLAAIPEGDVTMKIAFTDAADENLYVDQIDYGKAPEEAAAEEADDVTAEAEHLYKAGNPAEMKKQTVTVPVTITPGMPAFSIKLAKYSDQTGIGNIAADKAGYERRGDVIYLTNGSAALYNVAGALVATASANTIDMSALPAGLYILRTGKTAAKIVK